MMASTNVIKFNCLALIICIALCAPLPSMATLTCCQVKPALEACNGYARNGGDSVPQDCCFEALNLKNNIIYNHNDTIAACHCIQEAANKISDINATAFSIIPENCGIRLPFNFKVDMNCDRVATYNKTLLEVARQRKAERVELVILTAAAGKESKRRNLKGRFAKPINMMVNSTMSSSSRLNGHSVLCFLAIVEALVIALHNV